MWQMVLSTRLYSVKGPSPWQQMKSKNINTETNGWHGSSFYWITTEIDRSTALFRCQILPNLMQMVMFTAQNPQTSK